ncbi:MAG: hypothetical protein GXO48_09490 [Chlorobi bacterium]|nr:hypothetical protein [Chlorobiota bacterium]
MIKTRHAMEKMFASENLKLLFKGMRLNASNHNMTPFGVVGVSVPFISIRPFRKVMVSRVLTKSLSVQLLGALKPSINAGITGFLSRDPGSPLSVKNLLIALFETYISSIRKKAHLQRLDVFVKKKLT